MLDPYLPANLRDVSDTDLRWYLQHEEDYSPPVYLELVTEAARRGL